MEKIRRDKHMGKAYDVAVIGAGAIGSSVAYFNAKKGASVVLIDAGDIAQSTSSRSDGMSLSAISSRDLTLCLQRQVRICSRD